MMFWWFFILSLVILALVSPFVYDFLVTAGVANLFSDPYAQIVLYGGMGLFFVLFVYYSLFGEGG